jgi:putative acetyltransferase
MIIIRGMRASDRDVVISLHKQSIFGLCRDHYNEQEMKAWTDRLTPELFDEGIKDENNIAIAAIDGTVMIGYGFFNVQKRELFALYVLPRFTNRGAGRLIMARLEDLAREKNLESLSLQATANAVGFYKKLGYQEIKAEMHRINDMVSIACIRMKKTYR